MVAFFRDHLLIHDYENKLAFNHVVSMWWPPKTQYHIDITPLNHPESLGGGGGNLISIMPGCVCPKVKEMGSFSASSEGNESEDVIQNGCKICCFILYV